MRSMTTRSLCLSVLLISLLAGCGRPAGEGAETAQGSPEGEPPAALNDARFHEALLQAAREYPQYGNVDDMGRWAPTLCRLPGLQIRESASADGATHGRKLYWLHAKDREAYVQSGEGREQPVGQVIVKEAFEPVPGAGDPLVVVRPDRPGRIVTTVTHDDGRQFHAGDKHALFVMLKLEAQTPGTDGGWVYGTVSPDGRAVTSAGRLASCMHCHTQKTHDRMFGRP